MTGSTASIRNDIDELEKRLVKMDFKLETAKNARDEYVSFLRQKYPSWKPPEMQIHKQQLTSNRFQRSILDSLATNKYHWDLNKQFIAPCKKLELNNFEPNDPIPTCGPALEPDLIMIKKRLKKIAEDLENLREHRLYLSTADYYLSLGPEFCSSKSQSIPWKRADKSNVDQLKSLYDLRKQINQIDPCILLDTPLPNAEDFENMRMEYLKKNTNSTEGRSDDQVKGNFEQSLTDKMKNSNIPTGHQKELSHLQEVQRTEANSTLRETFDLSQMLNGQEGDQKSSSQEVMAAKSRPVATESTWQPSHLPNTTDDGFNFLAKILGSSANSAADDKPTFMNRFNDGMLQTVDLNVDDSDSDFFA
ncbi:unnamed protein product [Cercopithifilaria johnstoni]|uniref:Uncharacterized protein n=1 Tax=Cercopithifilaria johnstoni TaxID=2874296 RepID=A0A8J2MCH7_9BILA|nr:unnamed protein product [Cercopithifilaria johnstoni]